MRAITKSRWWRLLGLVVALVWLVNCGDAGGNDGADAHLEADAADAAGPRGAGTDYQAWWADQTHVIAPWVREIDAELMKEAVIEEARLTFPRSGNDALIDLEVGDVLMAHSLDEADLNVSRRVLSVAVLADTIVVETEDVSLDHILLKFDGDEMFGGEEFQYQQQPLQEGPDFLYETRYQELSKILVPERNPIFDGGAQFSFKFCKAGRSYTFCGLACQASAGGTPVAGCGVDFETDEKPWGQLNSEEMTLTVGVSASFSLNQAEVFLDIGAPSDEYCKCTAYWWPMGWGRIKEECGRVLRGVKPSWWPQSAEAVEEEVLAMKRECTGDGTAFKLGSDVSVTFKLDPITFEFGGKLKTPEKWFEKKLPLPFPKITLPVFAPPPITLVVEPELIFAPEAGVSGKALIGLSGDNAMGATLAVNAGIKYVKGEGLEMYSPGPAGEAVDLQLHMGPPTVDSSVTMYGKVGLNLDVATKLMGVAGPVFSPGAYAQLEGSVGGSSENGLVCEPKFSLGATFDIGGEVTIPFTDVGREAKFNLFDTCQGAVGEFLKDMEVPLCWSPSTNFCAPDNKWIRIGVERDEAVGDNPPGVDIDSVWLLSNRQGAEPIAPDKIILAADYQAATASDELPAELMSNDADYLFLECGEDNDGASPEYWQERVLSVPEGQYAWLRFPEEIKPGLRIALTTVDRGFCKSTGVPTLSIGDPEFGPQGTWSMDAYTPGAWRGSNITVLEVKEGEGVGELEVFVP